MGKSKKKKMSKKKVVKVLQPGALIDLNSSLDNAVRELRGLKPSLNSMEELPCELIDWLKGKELSVRQAKDLLVLTEDIIDKTWRTEEGNVML